MPDSNPAGVGCANCLYLRARAKAIAKKVRNLWLQAPRIRIGYAYCRLYSHEDRAFYKNIKRMNDKS